MTIELLKLLLEKTGSKEAFIKFIDLTIDEVGGIEAWQKMIEDETGEKIIGIKGRPCGYEYGSGVCLFLQTMNGCYCIS